MILGVSDTTHPFIPVYIGGEGTGFYLWGDAGTDQLIARVYPVPAEEMTLDTTRVYKARACLKIARSGAMIESPLLLESSKVPQWDSTVIKTLHGWVFQPTTDSLRLDTVEILYVAKKASVEDSIVTGRLHERINPAAFTTVEEILGENTQVDTPTDSIAPLNITFTFTGEVDMHDLESYLEPQIRDKMEAEGMNAATARFGIKVNDSGWIDEVTVYQSSGKTFLDSELEKAMKQWRFRPSFRPYREAEVIFVIELE